MKCNKWVKLISPVPRSVLERVSPGIEEREEGVIHKKVGPYLIAKSKAHRA
jgi:hypothetical protein